MSSFNEYFKKEGAGKLVRSYINEVDLFNTKYKITKLDYSIIEEPQRHPVSYYLETETTATFKVQIEYELNGDGVIHYSTFEVPGEVDGSFIIEGAFRIQFNKLDSDFDCRIRTSGTGSHIINFDNSTARSYNTDTKILTIKRNFRPEIKREVTIPLDQIDNMSQEDKDFYLKLTDRQIKKFQIKLDLDYKPEYITTKLIDECIAFGDDRDRDLIIDKKINNIQTGFMQYMIGGNKRNLYTTRSAIVDYFTKYNKIQDELNNITLLTIKYFKGSSEAKKGDAAVQVASGINAINFQSISSKITIPKTVAYNSTFADLIDIADTPINQNTNVQNSLTVSAHVTEEGVLFDVFTTNFTKITIQYMDYLNSKVCASEYVDYKSRKILPNKDGKVEVKYRMKRIMVPVDEVQLVDLHPDYRLSSAARRIPFINSTDSVRISMGCSMLLKKSSNVVIRCVYLVKCWKPLKINYSRFGHL